jgi:hypothetical protein
VTEPLGTLVDRELTADEARAYLDQPVGAEEREDVRTLIRWFTTRYPTPAARLAYVRRAHARWTRLAGRDRIRS